MMLVANVICILTLLLLVPMLSYKWLFNWLMLRYGVIYFAV